MDNEERSDCADEWADLSLDLVQMSEGLFSQFAARNICDGSGTVFQKCP